MSEVSERASSRLDNLENIEPLLASLRVLSLSTMQMAINRKEHLHTYKGEFLAALADMLQAVKTKDIRKILPGESSIQGSALLVILGSERGICGTFNKALVSMALEWQAAQPGEAQILSFGKRLEPLLKQTGLEFSHQPSLSQGSMPRYQKAKGFFDTWLAQFNAGDLAAVDVLSFRKASAATYKPEFFRLLPAMEPEQIDRGSHTDWPPPIIEGDPLPMVKQTYELLLALRFYELILDSIEAENAIRYNLLEEAKENTAEIIEDLKVDILMARRQAVTQQIQELAVSAGLTA